MKKNMILFISVNSNMIGNFVERNLLKIFFSEIYSGIIWRRVIEEEEYDFFLFYQIKYNCKFPREKFSEDLQISSGIIWRRFIDEEYNHSSRFCQIKYDWRSPREKSSEDLLFRHFFKIYIQ